MNKVMRRHFAWENSIYQRGYVALLLVLVVGAVSLAITVSLVLLGTDALRSSQVLVASMQARAAAEACAHAGLQALRDDANTAGTTTKTLTTATCAFTVTSLGGESRRIDAQGTSHSTVRKVQVEINDISPQILITHWKEVADF